MSYIDIDIVKRNKAIKVIQRAWRHAFYDPCYSVCKRRLVREFMYMDIF
jgi:hypothetical protein